MASLEALPILLKELRLSTIGNCWEALAQQALDGQWLPQQYLAALCEEEVNERYQQRLKRYLHEAQLPAGKRLSHFDFSAVHGIKANQVKALVEQPQWVKQAHNLLLFGPSGIGKTHLACGIAAGLLEKGFRAKFFSATVLVQQLQQAKQKLLLAEMLQRLDRYDVLLLDDIGYVKKSNQETQVLFELIAHRYETGSLIITSNHPFSEWGQIFEDNMMTVAAIDRLVHHATILECQGESYRRQSAINRRQN